jgi:hypothetical protein
MKLEAIFCAIFYWFNFQNLSRINIYLSRNFCRCVLYLSSVPNMIRANVDYTFNNRTLLILFFHCYNMTDLHWPLQPTDRNATIQVWIVGGKLFCVLRRGIMHDFTCTWCRRLHESVTLVLTRSWDAYTHAWHRDAEGKGGVFQNRLPDWLEMNLMLAVISTEKLYFNAGFVWEGGGT